MTGKPEYREMISNRKHKRRRWLGHLESAISHREAKQRSRTTLLEVLEPRLLLSTVIVDTEADTIANDGKTSLREAINMVNDPLRDVDEIRFADNVRDITLTFGTEMIILDPVRIVGPTDVNGAPLLTISGDDTSRIFRIQADAGEAVMLEHLRLTNGYTAAGVGGAVVVLGGEVTLDFVAIRLSSALSGGGIAMLAGNANLTMTHSLLRGNQSTSGVGGQGGGGAYFVLGPGQTVSISDTGITGNTSAREGGGIYIVASGNGSISLTDSIVTGNQATVEGGGLAGRGVADVSLNRTTLSDNTAGAGGGIVLHSVGNAAVTDSVITGNAGGTGAGGVYLSSTPANILRSSIDGNTGGTGGISAFDQPLTIQSSTISRNTGAQYGGVVVLYADLTVINSTVSGNTGQTGGGVLHHQGVLSIDNSTISGNTGLHATVGTGGLVLSLNDATVRSSIIAGNTGYGSSGGDDIYDG